jgi:hypothetical protein
VDDGGSDEGVTADDGEELQAGMMRVRREEAVRREGARRADVKLRFGELLTSYPIWTQS